MLAEGGHDIENVLAEGLSGQSDERIDEACGAEGRTLITLDLDFANPIRFPPGPTQGIVVVRPPRAVLSAIRATLVSVMDELKNRPVSGTLWIVEPGRIRIHAPEDADPPRGEPPVR